MPECKSCPYFDKKKSSVYKSMVLVGFCNLRSMFVTDKSVVNIKCAEKAIIPLSSIKDFGITSPLAVQLVQKHTKQLPPIMARESSMVTF